jgi:hypothetical protein
MSSEMDLTLVLEDFQDRRCWLASLKLCRWASRPPHQKRTTEFSSSFCSSGGVHPQIIFGGGGKTRACRGVEGRI